MNNMITKLKNQRGSALLLTLGILSLVLIMAMSFAFSARTTRQVAKVNADQVKARLLAESGLERVVAAMKFNYNGDVYPSEQDAAPSWTFQAATGTGVFQKFLASPGTDYQIKRSTPTDPPSLTEMALPIVNNFTSPTAIGFQRVEVDPGTGAETIGRVAFLVMEEANKLDINQMVTLRMPNSTPADNRPFVLFDTALATPAYSGVLPSLHDNFSNTRGDFLYDISATELTLTPVDETNTVRLGLTMQEIRIDGLYRSKLTPGFPGTAAPSAGTVTPWFSYRHLWNVVWDTTASPVLPVADALKYTFFSGEDIEAYWDGATERQRFDVTGFEWGSSTGDFYVTDPVNPAKYILNPARSGWHHSGTLAGAQTLVTALVTDNDREVFWDAVDPLKVVDSPTVGDTGFGIPYLKDLEYATANHGKQIAANMVDFCDSDSLATYYMSSAYDLASSSQLDYCGNEAVLYFNEIVAKVVAYKTSPSSDGDLTASDFSFEVVLYPELLNIFTSARPVGRIRIRLVGQAQINIGGGAYVDLPTFNSTTPLDFTWSLPSPTDAQAQGFYTPSSVTVTLDPPRKILDTSSVAYRFQVSRIVMISDNGSDGDIYDTGFFDTALASVDIDARANADAAGYPVCISWEVGDPRLNHKSAAWTMRVCDTGEDELYATPPNCPTLGTVNQQLSTAVAAATSPDIEVYGGMDFSAADKTFSTAFIPNRPIKSLWELGAIHRGEPFRTLAIADADKAILDQVKIGPLKRTRGKFNLYSSNPAAIERLLSNIDVTTSYDAVSGSETASCTVSPGALPATLTSSRGDFADVFKYSTGANDREREALLGRTANLLTTRMDKYSVLVVGQALKELVGVTATTWPDVQKTAINPIEIEDPPGVKKYYSVLGTQRILAHLVRDAWRNEYKVVQMQLLED